MRNRTLIALAMLACVCAWNWNAPREEWIRVLAAAAGQGRELPERVPGSHFDPASSRARVQAGLGSSFPRDRVATVRVRDPLPGAAPSQAAEPASLHESIDPPSSLGSGPPAISLLRGARRAEAGEGVASAEVWGHDRQAPRALTLWQVDPRSGRAAPLAYGESGTDGRFVFERVPAPPRATELRVTPRGASPVSPDASSALALEALAPPTPSVHIEEIGEHWRIALRALPNAEVWLEDEAGRRTRHSAPSASARSRPQVFTIERPAPVGVLQVAQILPDGRRSAWSPVSPAPVPAIDAVRLQPGGTR